LDLEYLKFEPGQNLNLPCNSVISFNNICQFVCAEKMIIYAFWTFYSDIFHSTLYRIETDILHAVLG